MHPLLTDRVLDNAITAMECSEVARTAALVRRDGGVTFALGEVVLRPLYPEEVACLERFGNVADDWSRIRVAPGFDWRRVRGSTFQGDVILGRFAARMPLAGGSELPAGIYQSTVANCVIGNDALVREVRLLANYVVGEGALLWDCGSIVGDGPTAFGNGQELPLGNESVGRGVRVYAEITTEVAAAVARAHAQRPALDRYQQAVAAYLVRVTSTRGILERGATAVGTPKVHNTYVGPHARIDGATLVTESTLLSSADEPAQVLSGACVRASLLQWGSRVSTLAIVERAVLTEHAHAEQHAKVRASLLGPNTGVAAGEVSASLLGPFVGFHHQALLIAAFWPAGRGNVSYGANVGSNHTSRAPDQEFWPGEGLFLGLGVNVKYPSDFSRAPYSVIACGVSMPPQKVTFPFSLINAPSPRRSGDSPAANEIVPAWLLTHNLFALKRNEAKYRTRDQARRTRFSFEVFRPDMVDLMRDACCRLEGVSAVKDVYTDRDIGGLGKNYLLEANRDQALEAYRFFIRHYALLGLKERAQAALRGGCHGGLDHLLTTPGDDPVWEHQRQLLTGELGVRDARAALAELPAMLERIGRDVENSRARDDERGRQIIDDYAETHIRADEDPFVRKAWAEIRHHQQEVADLLARTAGILSRCAGSAGPRSEGPERAYPLFAVAVTHVSPADLAR